MIISTSTELRGEKPMKHFEDIDEVIYKLLVGLTLYLILSTLFDYMVVWCNVPLWKSY
jgi:hypothetical protein